MVNPVVKNYFDPITKKFIVSGEMEITADGKLTVLDGGEVVGITGVTAAATADTIGGVKATAKGEGDTVECKIDGTTSKLYCAPYELPVAAADATGGIKAATRSAGDTVECKIDEATSKLYCAPYELPEAAADAIGGVKLAANVAAVDTEGELADVITALNALLVALKASGAMAADG